MLRPSRHYSSSRSRSPQYQRVLSQPGYFFNLEGGPYLIVSSLTEPGTFTEDLRRLTTA